MERKTRLWSSLLLGRLTSCSVPHGRRRRTERRKTKRRTQPQVFVSFTGSSKAEPEEQFEFNHAHRDQLSQPPVVWILVTLTLLFYSEPCAVMPPLEIFMEVSYEERRAMLYRDLERGDVVIGRINNIREYGFFLTLLCTAVGLKRDIEDLELSVGQASLNPFSCAE